jgi:hypothetical protein
MRIRPFFPLPLLVMLSAQALPPAGASGLSWDKTVVEIDAAPLAERIDAIFPFANTSGHPISIVSAVASCGCTVPRLEKTAYAPGENGELHAWFTPDDRVGLRQEEVTLVTDEPGAKPQVLLLRVNVPKLYEVAPYFVIWRGGEAPEPREIRIRIADPTLLAPAAIKPRDPRIVAVLEKLGNAPGSYVARIHPTTTEAPFESLVDVELAGAGGARRTIHLYAVIRATPIDKNR